MLSSRPESKRSVAEPGPRHKATRIAKWHEDLDQPGSRADRPGLNAAMERVEAGATGGLVVARLDCFGRSVQDSAFTRPATDFSKGAGVAVRSR